ncbi:cysteinyl leukotriene receptor 1-like [Littorina saxatilis]|uniref:cysteinyl leukotriene receptor 1-like n=1 Tax=Littorina saxatilis TaxID=31220 RepID=UPI0038B50480
MALYGVQNSSAARMQGKTVLPGGANDSISGSSSNNNMSLLAGSNLSDYYDTFFNYYDECGMESLLLYPEYQAAGHISTFLYPVLLVLGTLGNVASLLLLRHLSNHAWSSCLYLAVLSVVELVVLYIRCGGPWLDKVAGINPFFIIMTSSDAMCKINLFVLNVFLQMWPWLMVALSVELLISVRFPLKTYECCTTERARATILLITILLVCLNLNFFWTWGLVEQDCLYIEEFSLEFLNVIWPSIEMTVKHILPLLVVTVCFFVIVVSLLRSGREGQASYEPILRKYFLDLQALHQLKHASLIVVLFFIIVKTFTFALELLNALMQKGIIEVPCDQLAQFQANFELVKAVRDASIYCFHSLKFFIFFAFCASFRKQFFSVMRKIFFCCKAKQTGSGPRKAKDNNAANRLEQNENAGHAASAQRNATRHNDANSHNPPVLNKTTHV